MLRIGSPKQVEFYDERKSIVEGNGIMSTRIRIINLEEGFPTREQAYQKLETALARARKDGVPLLKVIHGYGSTGAGGVLRFAIRSYLRQRKEKGEIVAFVNGESLSSFDERSKTLFAWRCWARKQGNHASVALRLPGASHP
jgi:Smr domain